MGLETATFISDFDASLPTSTDLRSQGDDHIRLEKTVLKNTFPTATKAFYFPNTAVKTVDFVVVATDMNKTFLCNTSGAALLNVSLPTTLGAGDAGWECFLIKTTTDANPMIVGGAAGTVSSGQISGLTTVRRCIPGARIQCLWTGTFWQISRAVGLPVGSCIEFHGPALPAGYEWPNGQTLAFPSTRYPEYNSVIGSGVTLDKRGRLGIPLDNLGGAAAGRLAGGIITGTAIGNVGGTDTVTLDRTMIPTGITSRNAAQAISATNPYGFPNNGGALIDTLNQGASSPVLFWRITPNNGLTTLTYTGTADITVTSNNTGGGAHSNLQPSIMVAQILIVE